MWDFFFGYYETLSYLCSYNNRLWKKEYMKRLKQWTIR